MADDIFEKILAELIDEYEGSRGKSWIETFDIDESRYGEVEAAMQRIAALLRAGKAGEGRHAERLAAGLNLLDNLQHEIGNPVFAIETNLGSLRKRVEHIGKPRWRDEAAEILDEIQASLEKIKAAITARKA